MNLDSSFSTQATSGTVTTAAHGQIRAEYLLEELKEVRAKMDKANCQFDQQISELELTIQDIKKRKRRQLSPLEFKEQDLVDQLREIYGVSMNRVESRRREPSSYRRFQSISSLQSHQSLNSFACQFQVQSSWITKKDEQILKSIDRRIKVLQERIYGSTMPIEFD